MPATLLAELAADPPRTGDWAPVVADLARQYANHQRLIKELEAHPERRYPPAALRRHIQVRDRTCAAPGCRRPASQTDMDHTLDHARGGPTTSVNIGPLCPRHHAMKHEGGWRLQQPEPGVFRWTSPLGRRYVTRGEPVQPPLPEPVERAPDEIPDEPPETLRDEGPIFHHTPPPKPAEPQPPPPPRNDPNEPPPF